MQDIIDSMNAKLGKETSAMIADDISQMLSFESESTKTIQNKDKEISRLKDNNEKLKAYKKRYYRSETIYFRGT